MIFTRNPGHTLLWLACLVVLPSSLLADRVELVSGDVFLGRVLRINAHEVSVQLESGGIISFSLSAVRSVRQRNEEGEESKVLYDSDRDPASPKVETGATRPGPAIPPDVLEKFTILGPTPSTQQQPGMVTPSAGVTTPVKPRSAGPASATGPVMDDLLEAPVNDERFGFTVAPPRGFVKWPEAEAPGIAHAFKDPFTLTSFVVATYASADPVDKLKRNTLRSYTEQYKIFHVIRDEEVTEKSGKLEQNAWLVEIESRIGTVAIHQVLLFTRSDLGAVVLTYTATGENYARFEAAFLRSIESFSFAEPEADWIAEIKEPSPSEKVPVLFPPPALEPTQP